MSKEKNYTINYFFNGNGIVDIKAKSKKEAEDKFRNGDFEDDKKDEWGEEFVIESIDDNNFL